MAKLVEENKQLRERSNRMEVELDKTNAQLKRNNLIFYGIEQPGMETWDTTEKIVRDFITDNLDINAGELEFQRVYRLTGAHSHPQPIIANFLRYKQRMQVLRAANKLKGTDYRIGEDYTWK
ncbi:uncharacterized protein LOC144341901, partial [Saccoglossus kowalevskii]